MNQSIYKFLKNIFWHAIPLMPLIIGCLYYAFVIFPELSGDLGLLGKITFGKEYGRRILQPELDSVYFKEYEQVDKTEDFSVITIGDSYCRREKQGFQNYLAHRLKKPVININETSYSPQQLAVGLLNAGFFDTLSTRFLILESGQRVAVKRHLMLDLKNTLSIDLKEILKRKKSRNAHVLQEGFKQACDWMLLSLNLSSNPVLRAKLSSEYFTAANRESELYFYEDDLIRLSVSEEEFDLINSQIVSMREMFAAKGISLIYLVAPDKYDVYQPYIIENPYPARMLGGQFLALNSIPGVIFPLNEFRDQVKQGVLDFYQANDTHWSQTAAKMVADMIYAEMNSDVISAD